MSNNIIVFTDGSCINNGKKCAKGGMGVHFPNNELPDLSTKFELGKITNQRAELGAIYLSLKYLKENFDDLKKKKIEIFTDSKYSINCLNRFVKTWEKNNWKTVNGKDVLNQDLIKSILKYIKKYDIEFTHVLSHQNDQLYATIHNNIADKLAVSATK